MASLVESAILNKKLAHAYLLVGRAFDDKEQIALETACFLNCSKDDKWQKGACAKLHFNGQKLDNACQNCRWLIDREHPQAWLVLDSEGKKSGKIPVEKARLLSEELAKTSIYWRVIVVPEANSEAFHRPPANALLKTLEEPGENTLFFLFAQSVEEVLPTLTSRCQVIPTTMTYSFGLWTNDKKAINGRQDEKQKTDDAPPLAYELNLKLAPFLKKDHASAAEFIHFAQEIKAFAEPNDALEEIIDFVAAEEIKRLASKARENQATLTYLTDLLALAETTKQQVDHYVSEKAAIEVFAQSLRNLKVKHARELSLGKTR